MNITIVGAGTIGLQLCNKLAYDKSNITIIEIQPERAAVARESVDAIVIEGSASSISTLKKANIQNSDIFIALTNNDELNIFSCQLAKKLNVKNTIARVRNQDFLKKDYLLSKEELGVDLIIHPEIETAKAIIRLIRQSSSTDSIEFDDGKIQFTGIRLDKNTPILRTPLMELGKKLGNPALRIVAIKRGQYTIIPSGTDMLFKGDQVFFTCDPNYMTEALQYFGKKDVKISDIMIIGGGQIGGYLSRTLEKELDIKVIENNQEKAENLAADLKRTLLIKGDGSDLDLLIKENLRDMDEFIAVTGDDETNIITSIIARHMEVPRTITLIRKSEYLPLTPTLGLDAVVSKQQITVNAIEKYIRRQKVAFIAEIPGVDAEIIEFIASNRSKVIRKQLKDIHFPNNSIIGAVLKNENDVIIPTGTTQIEAGDKVVVFTLPSAIKNVEKMF